MHFLLAGGAAAAVADSARTATAMARELIIPPISQIKGRGGVVVQHYSTH